MPVLMAHPDVLHDVLSRYEAVQAPRSERDSSEIRRRREDLAYTLCVLTGTRAIEDALARAGSRLAAAPTTGAGASRTAEDTVALTA
ncbi:DUF5133 domain-containing protein [Streptomyces sp. NPDC088725]|uniref:DUF5133 domain-containing protein n=1 Tax=Streptomyces sp. NPDC088725 TaxID=3365873 RepID=UPI00380F2E1F